MKENLTFLALSVLAVTFILAATLFVEELVRHGQGYIRCEYCAGHSGWRKP